MYASLEFERDGAQRFPAAAAGVLDSVEHVLAALPEDRPGLRLTGIGPLAALLTTHSAIGRVAASAIGERARPVRALLLDKNEATNWSLAWHQDRTIAVVKRKEVDGFGPWTIKQGLQHVAPPFEILAAMVTLRVHLDPVPMNNAPLLVAPGSHRLGRVAEADVEAIVARCGTAACEAAAGDIWLYATPVLHASDAAVSPARRRVLQVDYASADLPGGLEWLGV